MMGYTSRLPRALKLAAVLIDDDGCGLPEAERRQVAAALVRLSVAASTADGHPDGVTRLDVLGVAREALGAIYTLTLTSDDPPTPEQANSLAGGITECADQAEDIVGPALHVGNA